MDARFLHLSIVSLLTAVVGIYPYWVRRNNLTRWFALAHGSLALWCMNEILAFVPISHDARLIIYRLTYILGVTMVLYWYRFILEMSGWSIADFPRNSLGIKVVGWICIGLTFTPWLVTDIQEGPPFREIPGPAYPAFIVLFVWFLASAIFQCYRGYKRSTGHQRNRLKYLFLANALILAGVVFFFASVYGANLGYFYFYLEVAYACIVAYAILADQLMDIAVIIRKTAISSAMMAILTMLYLLIVPALTRLFQGEGSSTVWSSVIAAFVITLVFNPLLDWVRAFMDRKFLGEWLQDMSRGVVHEVRRPLSGISLPANFVLFQMDEFEKGKLPLEDVVPKVKEQMRLILGKSAEMTDRLEALQALCGMYQANGAEAANLRQVAEECLGRLQYFLDEWKVSVDADIPVTLEPVRCDPKQLAIVVTNLIKNAADALRLMKTPRENPQVTLKAWASSNDVFISVKDNGPGMSSETQGRLFQMGFTTKGGQGMGIGLHLIRTIVQNHQGSIDVKSTVDVGTEFLVRLPQGKLPEAKT